MNMVTNEWMPDTCGCVLEYEWDRDLDVDHRECKVKSVKKACAFHTHHAAKETHWNDVLEENQRKNLAIRAVAKLHGSLRKNDDQETPDYSKIHWSYTVDRVLELTLEGVPSADKPAMRQALDVELGTGKVKIV